MRGVMDILEYGEDAVSVAFEEVAPADWRPKVFELDIVAKWANLTKHPNYGTPLAGQGT